MRKQRWLGASAALVSMMIVLAACQGASTSPSPSMAEHSMAASTSAAPSVHSDLKIGVVSDAAGINDKGFNEYSYKGAQQGAAKIGAAAPKVIVPKDQTEYSSAIQSLVDEGTNIIVTVGFNLGAATIGAAKANPDVWFVGVDQQVGPGKDFCVDEQGNLDSKYACKGDATKLLPKYIQLVFKEDQAGYLAGMVAASVSKSGVIGAVGGLTTCGPCVRYIQGYELGAKSVKADAVVKGVYVTTSFDPVKSFGDQPGGKLFAQNLLASNPTMDVLFAVGGLTGNGVLDAACDKGLWAIGVDVDQFLSYAADSKCILTSAEKHLSSAVATAIEDLGAGPVAAGALTFDATNDGVGVSDFHTNASAVPADLQGKLDAALAAMKAGTLVTCPANCGAPPK
ncbi:MAG: BMP family ABC transporter substrate-binding protein [Chloroflexota bacterium]